MDALHAVNSAACRAAATAHTAAQQLAIHIASHLTSVRWLGEHATSVQLRKPVLLAIVQSACSQGKAKYKFLPAELSARAARVAMSERLDARSYHSKLVEGECYKLPSAKWTGEQRGCR